MKSTNLLLKVENLSKAYGDNRLFSNLSFSLYEKERLGLLGKNGTGKSTLAKILIKYEEPTAGKIYLYGKSAQDYSKEAWSKKVQYIGQYTRNTLDPTKTIEACLKEPLNNFKIANKQEQNQIIQGYLEKLNLDRSILKKRPLELSGGQYQRVCIALALLPEPSLIICDEMTASLDKISEIAILKFFREEVDKALIVISHNPYVVKYLCHNTLRLEDFK